MVKGFINQLIQFAFQHFRIRIWHVASN